MRMNYSDNSEYFIAMNEIKSTNKQSITRQLIHLALPVIGSHLFQMAYNLIDIFYVSRLGSSAVAAVGSAGFFLHMGWALSTLPATGAGIKVSHLVGQKAFDKIQSHLRTAWITVIMLASLTLLIILLFGHALINFYHLNSPLIEESAHRYLLLAGFGVLFFYQNTLFTSLFIGYGNTQIPFRINALGFITNMILDPILIFGFGWGILGAAAATLISQIVVTGSFIIQLWNVPALGPWHGTFRLDCLKGNIRLGISPAIQRIVFATIAIFMARIISNFGSSAIAAQRIGLQIESLTFMTVAGFSAAVGSLSGRAFGAKDAFRHWKIFRSGMGLAIAIGLITTTLFLVFPKTIFSIFIRTPEDLALGVQYLTILGYSQIFMSIEMVATGAFHGWGRTLIPSSISIILTSLRIPAAIYLTHTIGLGLSGIWWSITLSSIGKGFLISGLFVFLFKSDAIAMRIKNRYKKIICYKRDGIADTTF